MSTEWKHAHFFYRESNIYTFSRNPLYNNHEDCHIFIPWNKNIDFEYMFKIKKCIKDNNRAYIPVMDIDGNPKNFSKEILERISFQLAQNRETHLVMSNLESIHVYRISKIITNKASKKDKNLNCIPDTCAQNKYSIWFEVDDLFVLEVNHSGGASSLAVIDKLNELKNTVQSQNIFKPAPILKDKSNQEIVRNPVREKWVDMDRNYTYDYFIRQCKLKDNIYQDSWQFLARKTQHHLISSELTRHQGIFFRGEQKWKYLKSSIDHYMTAVFSELNELYVSPLIHSIVNYESLADAWDEVQSSLVDEKFLNLLQQLLSGEKKQIDSIEEFSFYITSAKSFLFTIKNRFAKKFHMQECLRVESFLSKQESLIEALVCRSITESLNSLVKIQEWVHETDKDIQELDENTLQDCNLKISHLLSMASSASYEDNVFFKLVEEKTAKGVAQQSFNNQVKNLLSIDLKKTA